MHLSVFVLCFCVVVATAKQHYLSDEFINEINRKQSTWRAGRNFDENTPDRVIKSLAGVKRGYKSTLPRKIVKVADDLPSEFDARKQWPECKDLIGEVRDQAACGACWAFSAVSAMSDRLCIASNGTYKDPLSANDLISCCADCGNGCNGGYPSEAWKYWTTSGIVTGGGYGSNKGCQTYVYPPCRHEGGSGSLPACAEDAPTPECTKKCDDGSSLEYRRDLFFGQDSYTLSLDEEEIMTEIMTNGPVESTFDLWEDFLSYKEGVYQYTSSNYLGGHTCKIIGWGFQKHTPYWLAVNSWNEDWGDKGLFKILRGQNEVGIEFSINAGTPLV